MSAAASYHSRLHDLAQIEPEQCRRTGVTPVSNFKAFIF